MEKATAILNDSISLIQFEHLMEIPFFQKGDKNTSIKVAEPEKRPNK